MGNEDVASFEFLHLSLSFIVKKNQENIKNTVSKSSLRDFISKPLTFQSLSPLLSSLVFDH